jgi:hypothetical protein
MQTLHVAQMPEYHTGESVFITATPPTGTSGSNFSTPKSNFPTITPYVGVNLTQTINNYSPYWMSQQQNGISFDTGTYGNWSGAYFFDLNTFHPVQAIDKGQWYLPPTGGAFLHVAYNQASNGLYPGPNGVEFTSTLSQTQPLYPGPGGFATAGDTAPPLDYANAYYSWKGQGYMNGNGWNNFYEGNKGIGGFGNASAVMICTIVDNIPLLTWLGNRQVTAESVFVWPTFTSFFHLG